MKNNLKKQGHKHGLPVRMLLKSGITSNVRMAVGIVVFSSGVLIGLSAVIFIQSKESSAQGNAHFVERLHALDQRAYAKEKAP